MERNNRRRYSAKTFKLLKRLVTKSEYELAKNRRVLFSKGNVNHVIVTCETHGPLHHILLFMRKDICGS